MFAKKPLLLILEDDPNLLYGLRDALELCEYQILTAENGKQGLDILNRCSERLPNLIISDIMMPRMNGLEFLREVRQHVEWKHIPFIFLTAKGEKTDVQYGKTLGVDDYLIKPFDAEDLLTSISAQLQRVAEIREGFSENLESEVKASNTPRTGVFTPPTYHILIADDIKEVRESYRKLLASESRFSIIEASDGEEVLAELKANTPNLILMDINMPRLDGISVVRQIREISNLRHVPIIIISVDYYLQDHPIWTDIQGFLVKPVENELLLNIVKQKLGLIEEVMTTINLDSESDVEQVFESQGTRILVAEDVHYLRNDSVEMLRYEGYEVRGAENGRVALQLLQDFIPDVILCDIMMPEMDGFGVLQAVRDNPAWNHIQFIFLTAKTDRSDIRMGIELGAVDYLTKPFMTNELLDAINAALSRFQLRKHLWSQAGITTGIVEFLSKRILIVGGPKFLRKEITKFLFQEGYEVRETPNGRTALKILTNFMPDIIFSEIEMAYVNGYELLNKVRHSSALKHIQFIFLTKKADRLEIRTGMSRGADDYLTKPFLNHELLGAINAATRRSQNKSFSQQDQIIKRAINTVVGLSELWWNSVFAAQLVVVLIFNNEYGGLEAKLIKHNEFNAIAEVIPKALIFCNYRTNLRAIEVLRNFALSINIPFILIEDHYPGMNERLNLIQLGIDEVIPSELNMLELSVLTAIQQYKHPQLVEIGKTWIVLTASPDFGHRTEVADTIEQSFNAQVIDADTSELCLELACENAPDLLIIDETLNGVTLARELRQVGVNAPIILLTEIDTSPNWEHFALNIRGCVPYNHIINGIVPSIQRLLRWGREPRSLRDNWANYRLQATELEYEYYIRQMIPSVATTLEETGKLFSGLIHDLRNALYSQVSQLDKVSSQHRVAIQLDLSLASLLLENIAEARFKGNWNISEVEVSTINGSIQEAVELVKALNPSTFIEVREFKLTGERYCIDQRQFQRTIANVLVSLVGTSATAVVISADENSIIITGTELETFQFDANDFTDLFPTSLYTLTALKLVNRLGVNLQNIDHGIKLGLHPGGWPDEQSLRLDIAKYAEAAEKSEATIKSMTPPSVEPQITALIAPVAAKLTEILQQTTYKILQYFPNEERLITTSRYALLLAHNLLITSSGYTLMPYAVPLQPIFDVLYKLREDYLKNCTVDFSVMPGTPPVLADELALLQILVNLVTNAVEAINGRGRLSVRAAPYEDAVEIRVSDSGPGIPIDEQEKIFDLFYTTKRGHERGVGLHVVSSIVRELGGTITIDSIVGRGTTFILIIPAAGIVNNE